MDMDMSTDMDMGMTWWQGQFLKNYNIKWPVQLRYDTDSTRVRHFKWSVRAS